MVTLTAVLTAVLKVIQILVVIALPSAILIGGIMGLGYGAIMLVGDLTYGRYTKWLNF